VLIFLDRPKNLAVMRLAADGSGASRREKIGSIPKNSWEVSADLLKLLTPEEKTELDGTIEFYKTAAKTRRTAAAMSFPETAREVVSYLEEDASPEERRIIVAAIMEALRAVRIAAKGEAAE
jgi:hypothetical protein